MGTKREQEIETPKAIRSEVEAEVDFDAHMNKRDSERYQASENCNFRSKHSKTCLKVSS
jgi:hypothetical protein